MRRRIEPDEELDRLFGERDHVAIQISVALDSATVDTRRLELLQAKLKEAEQRIKAHGGFYA